MSGGIDKIIHLCIISRKVKFGQGLIQVSGLSRLDNYRGPHPINLSSAEGETPSASWRTSQNWGLFPDRNVRTVQEGQDVTISFVLCRQRACRPRKGNELYHITRL